MSDQWISKFQELMDGGWICSNDELKMCCFWYAFTGVLEAELDAFRQWWNTHRMRKTKTGQCPGGIPEDIFALPQLTGTQDYLCPIDSEVFGEAYEQLASVEPSFYSQKFEDAAQSCLSVMGIRAADIASENCVMVYKFLIAFIEYMHIN
ncbi:uncharacterized protein LOC134181593 [Corticium candelabrum]|uniref:uncharacterized protein LOC134181593 n=1 Tax=Corticium candelabrum TaxID=121492 RepID=UPI002E2545DE|nr:uncharacterized protein LOC134181593 [Corticium candelabrum]